MSVSEVTSKLADVQIDGTQPLPQRSLGKEALKDFMFDENYVNLNHGSYGTFPRQVRDALRRYQDMVEFRPDDFIRYKYAKMLDASRAALAKLMNAPLDTIVMVPNATTAINVVLHNLRYKEDDVIIYFDSIYGACEKVLAYMEETTPVKTKKVEYKYPIDDAELLRLFRAAIESEKAAGRKPKLALFDTIVSMPGVRMPFAALGQMCKEYGMLSLVDGAHGIGHTKLDMQELDFDFFVSNCHKWLLTARACAVFYVPERNQKLIRSTLPTSHGFVPVPRPGVHILNPFGDSDKSAFVYNFEYVGTTDNSPYLTVPDALRYRESLGGEAAIEAHLRDLARTGGRRVAAELGTGVMGDAEGTLGQCNMTNVRLPLDPHDIRRLAAERGFADDDYVLGKLVRDWLTMQFVERHNTFMALTVLYNGAWWVRLSAMVYLSLDDFEWGANVLNEECTRARNGDFLEWVAAQK